MKKKKEREKERKREKEREKFATEIIKVPDKSARSIPFT